MRQLRSVITLAVVLLVSALAPLPAGAAVTLGPDVTIPPPSGGLHLGAIGCQAGQYSPCLYVNMRSTNPAVIVAAPFDGVIVKWRSRAGCCTDPQTQTKTMTLVTVKQGVQDGNFGYVFATPVLQGTAFDLAPGNQILGYPATEFPARLPIKTGERIGIRADHPFAMGVDDTITGVVSSSIANGTVYGGEPYGQTWGVPMMMSADVEPDADGDGYGDESQDCAPADPATHDAGCSPGPPAPGPQDLLSVGINCNGPCPPSAGAGPTPTPKPTPLPPVVPIVSAVPASSDGTRFNVTLVCPPASTVRCGGVLRLDPAGGSKAQRLAAAKLKSYGSTTYSIAAGAKGKVSVKLNAAGRKALRKQGRLKVKLVLQPTGGPATSVTRTLKRKGK